jgi:hypothetical protein
MIKGGLFCTRYGSKFFNEEESAGIRFLKKSGLFKDDWGWTWFFDSEDELEDLFNNYAQTDSRKEITNQLISLLKNSNTPQDVTQQVLVAFEEKLDYWEYPEEGYDDQY